MPSSLQAMSRQSSHLNQEAFMAETQFPSNAVRRELIFDLKVNFEGLRLTRALRRGHKIFVVMMVRLLGECVSIILGKTL